MGRIVRALSEDGGVLCSAINSTDMVREMARLHEASPVVTAALGRMTTAASIMGGMLKYEGDTLTLRINGGGPCGTLTAVADYRGNVKCCVGNAGACVPQKPDGSLDVAGVIGSDGTLTVVKDMGLKEPYCGQIPLTSGNIADDITAYYAESEQLPTVVSLGIIFGEGAKIEAAGGFMVQVVPPISEKSIMVLEENIKNMDSINEMLERRLTPDEIALNALSGLGGDVLDAWEARYYCDCSRERTRGILMTLGKKEIEKLAGEQKETEVCCHFCNKKYVFSADELLKMLKE